MIRRRLCGIFLTHHADLRGDQVAQSVEPADVGLQVTGFTLPEETLTDKKTKITLNTHLVHNVTVSVTSCCHEFDTGFGVFTG